MVIEPQGWQKLDERDSTVAYFVSGWVCTSEAHVGSRGDEVTIWLGEKEVIDGEERYVLPGKSPKGSQMCVEFNPVSGETELKYARNTEEAEQIALQYME